MSSIELMKYRRVDIFVSSIRLVRYLGGSPLASYSPLGSPGRGSRAHAPPDVKYIHTHTHTPLHWTADSIISTRILTSCWLVCIPIWPVYVPCCKVIIVETFRTLGSMQ